MDSFELDKAHEPIFLAYIIKMRYITVSHFIVKKYGTLKYRVGVGTL